MSFPLQLPQGLHATTDLDLTTGIIKLELLTDSRRQICSMEDVSVLQQMPDVVCIYGRRERPFDLMLYEHAP